MLLEKTKVNAINLLTSKALIHSYINRDDLVSLNNERQEYNQMKEETKSSKNAVEYTI